MLITILIFIAGLIMLVISGELVVKSSLRLSQLIGLSEFAIGFVLLAIGSSLPELSIAVMSAFQGSAQTISVGNLLGSSIIDITLIFGIVCLFGFVLKKKDVEISEIIILSSIVAFCILVMKYADIGVGLFALVIFTFFTFIVLKRHYTVEYKEKKPWILTPELIKHALIIAGCLAAIIISAKLVIMSASDLALVFNVPGVVIGAVLVSLGTTLPELVISIMAMRKGNISLALGNAVGSVIVNMTLIMGLLASLSSFAIDNITATLISIFLCINAIFLVLVWRKKFGVFEGIVMIFLFIIFMTVMTLSGSIAFLNYS